jgi:hypothetical protein
MKCARFPTGYRGQRYEVRCCETEDHTTPNYSVGWTNDPTGGALKAMVEKHPSMHSPVVIDLLLDKQRQDDVK